MLRIVIPGEPVAQGRARFANGVAYTPERTRTWQGVAKTAASTAMEEQPPLDGPLGLELTFYLLVPRSWPAWKRQAALEGRILPAGRPDLDNFVKNAKDAFNSIVWHDDCQVVEYTIHKRFADVSRSEARVYTLEALAPQTARKRDLA